MAGVNGGPDPVIAAILGVSTLNFILLGWLGVTVLLNAEHRRLGVWLIAGALFSGTVFFVLQAAVAAHGVEYVAIALYFQWPLGWGIGILLPAAWYVTMLWYAGIWERGGRRMQVGHVLWLGFVAVSALVALWLSMKAARYPWISPEAGSVPFAAPSFNGTPLLVIVYPLFVGLYLALSLAVLLRPGPSRRPMGDIARRRARPWLIGTSFMMLLISLCVGALMMVLAHNAPVTVLRSQGGRIGSTVLVGDLVITCLVAVAVLLLGQAVMSYEVFTGKAFPRRELQRQWQNAVIFGAGWSLIVGWTAGVLHRPFLTLTLLAIVVTALLAVFSWRANADRARHIAQLRPFVTSARLYDAMLEPGTPQTGGAESFESLCRDILGTQTAHLVAAGPLSSLAGPPLSYPADAAPPGDLSGLVARAGEDRSGKAILDAAPGAGGETRWAVPLYGERGLIGLLLLGPKVDGGLYTQEETEIARAAGERLIDAVAAVRMARTLMALQRRSLSGEPSDGRSLRSVLHDDVLPRLHAAMLAIRSTDAGEQVRADVAVEQLAELHRELAEMLRGLSARGNGAIERGGLTGAIRRLVEDDFSGPFDAVACTVAPGVEQYVALLPVLTAEVLYYATREAIANAARHGRAGEAKRPLELCVGIAWRDGLQIVVEDTGVGFQPSDETSGTGQGVALHSTMMAVIGGGWVTESRPDEFTRVTLWLPEERWL